MNAEDTESTEGEGARLVQQLQRGWAHARREGWPAVGIFCTLAMLSASYTLFEAGFHAGHDNELHLVRLATLERCLGEGSLLCRWAPDFAHGLGSPLFQFYQPLPYYLALPFRLLGLSLTDAIDASYALSTWLLLLGAWLLGTVAGGRHAAPFAALGALWVSYHQWTIFVRGGLNESLGQAMATWVLWAWLRLMQRPTSLRRVVTLAALLVATLLAHPIVAVGLILPLAVWHLASLGVWWPRRRSLVSAYGLALLLGAFAWLPMLLERGNTFIARNMSTGFYDFRNHFYVQLEGQLSLFRGPWPTSPGVLAMLGGALGLLVISARWLLRFYLRTRPRWDAVFPRFEAGERTRFIAALSALGMAVFLTQEASTPLWVAFKPLLRFLQFPWRFGSIYVPFAALVAGLGLGLMTRALQMHRDTQWWCAAFVACCLAWWHAPSTDMNAYHEDTQRFDTLNTQTFWELQKHGAADYLYGATDIKAFEAYSRREGPESLATLLPPQRGHILAGEAQTQGAVLRVETTGPALLRVSNSAYPGWKARLNDGPWQPVKAAPGDALQRIGVPLPSAGRHRVELAYGRRLGHYLADGLTLLSLLGLAFWAYRRRQARSAPASPPSDEAV